MTANFASRTLWTGVDNIAIMRGMNSESVDLIYADPPFNSNRTYRAPIGSKAAGAAFKDAWTWTDADLVWLTLLRKNDKSLYSVIEAARAAHSAGMAAYLSMMAQRLAEMRRILKPTGSIYLHCDPTASHYLKLVMDAVFGKSSKGSGFRNEIIWCYPPKGNPPKFGFPRKHDVLLYYGKSQEGVFNHQYTALNAYQKGKFSKTDERGRQYKEFKGRRTYLDESKGRPVPSWWDDVAPVGQSRTEYIGYPTQKPLALLRRVIEASSNEGDMVMDPFCGCATACVAAEKLRRRWIGIDLSAKAEELVRDRLQKEIDDWGVFRGDDARVIHRTDLLRRTDMGDLPPYAAHKEAMYGEQKGDCGGCGHHFPYRNLTVDHIVRRKHGGTDHRENLWLLCQACNSSKGTMSQAEFIDKRLRNGHLVADWILEGKGRLFKALDE